MTEEEFDDELRRSAFAIAYRMLGSVGEAEDIVQEAFLRQQRAVSQGAEIESPKAFLSAVVTRLSIDQLRSARARRELYVGEWLPEPLLTDDNPKLDPADHAEQADSLSLAFLVLLERLTPVERAAFLLHDVFGYRYDEIAQIVGKSVENCRQLARRARRHIDEQKPRFEASRAQRERLAARFFAAVRMATSRRWSRRSPQTWSSTATAAARHRPGRARSSAATASAACSLVWAGSSRPPS
jgi:RNA polymerase sigma-70 factor, ECF subfamily